MPWYDDRLCAFDMESTGVDVETDRAVQAHIAHVGGDRPTKAMSLMIDPGIEIPEGAAAVHGITTERARLEGVPARGAIAALAERLQSTIVAAEPLVIYNAPFDLTLMDRECRRHGVTPPDFERAMVLDPLVIWKAADPFRRGSRNLAAACECFGVELSDAHDAGADALAAARVLWRMMRKTDLIQGRHPEIVQRRSFWKSIKDDLPTLHETQAQWAGMQARSLRMYFEGKGRHEDAASVREYWPVVPFDVAVRA